MTVPYDERPASQDRDPPQDKGSYVHRKPPRSDDDRYGDGRRDEHPREHERRQHDRPHYSHGSEHDLSPREKRTAPRPTTVANASTSPQNVMNPAPTTTVANTHLATRPMSNCTTVTGMPQAVESEALNMAKTETVAPAVKATRTATANMTVVMSLPTVSTLLHTIREQNKV
ncbi:hypothetical protein BWQ96_00878 [Gracilariopsis chorda]|uniref:Uncharacterized protein n=1 Tax=Gracilariopsis chorda TaxID=448386 RepID=A0A2V3J4J9_9FLOR|nr:hypothetical protein BWQ96_00878 [Gracilariopsis chorda]|eukprot:PXF49304.1 hypothetical protein BWQ96_00878 [Gracilariopsis chorda]